MAHPIQQRNIETMTITYKAPTPRPSVGTAIGRGLSGQCPACGRGRLFASYLKQVESCETCGEAFGHIRSDDAAPWLTILVVGHLMVPLILIVEVNVDWPLWLSFSVWIPLILAATFAVLPKAKGVFLGAIWAMKAPGSY